MHLNLALTNLLYPPSCLLCHTRIASSRAVMCTRCYKDCPSNQTCVCELCGITLSGAFDAIITCNNCRIKPPYFDMARAPWQYHGTIRHAIHQFKYLHRLKLGLWFIDDMTFLASRTLPIETIAIVLSVPPYWIKRWFRGFDSAAYLARQLASIIKKPYIPSALSRKHWTRSQTKLKLHQRADNVRDAFKANRNMVAGSNILLIDDVITSGATTNSCAQTLKDAGADKIYVLAAARTPLQ